MRRICWKRGMRLTDDIMRHADDCTADTIGKTLLLASSGRFGLIPSAQPFSLDVNVTKELVDVVSLTCLAVTKGGDIIDVNYDTRYSNAFDTRAKIPDGIDDKELILTVNIGKGRWTETNDGFEEPLYSFSLIMTTTPVPSNAVPIARIVDEYGWRIDDVDFVPPCLLVTSHYKFEELLQRFADLLATIDTKTQKALGTEGGTSAIGIFWPMVQQLRIATDKERDTMTPMTLLSNVQKCVSAFTCACRLDPALQLADEKRYVAYIMTPYNYKVAYQRIEAGLKICSEISEKVEKLPEVAKTQPEPQPEPQPVNMPRLATPVIAGNQLMQDCMTPETTIPLFYEPRTATIFFTTDGSNPTPATRRAAKGENGFSLKFENGFGKMKGKEPDKVVTLKMMAMANGMSSNVGTYKIQMHKSLKFRDVTPI